jgi:hypothetical protein
MDAYRPKMTEVAEMHGALRDQLRKFVQIQEDLAAAVGDPLNKDIKAVEGRLHAWQTQTKAVSHGFNALAKQRDAVCPPPEPGKIDPRGNS